MSDRSRERKFADELWHWYLTGEQTEATRLVEPALRVLRVIFGLLPGDPRCPNCNAPFSGVGAPIARLAGFRPSTFSPRRCNQCEVYVRKHEGGAQVELSMLFADVRGSTALAGERAISEYTTLIKKFYRISSDILIRHDALVNRLMGDQVIGLFVPRLSGSNHAKRAVEAAIEILRSTGHQEPDGPWIPVGVGVHSGEAFVGSVGSGDGVTEIAVLGDNANKAARLSSNAAAGELIVSEEAFASADLSGERWERRKLDLNGIREPLEVRIVRSDQGL